MARTKGSYWGAVGELLSELGAVDRHISKQPWLQSRRARWLHAMRWSALVSLAAGAGLTWVGANVIEDEPLGIGLALAMTFVIALLLWPALVIVHVFAFWIHARNERSASSGSAVPALPKANGHVSDHGVIDRRDSEKPKLKRSGERRFRGVVRLTSHDGTVTYYDPDSCEEYTRIIDETSQKATFVLVEQRVFGPLGDTTGAWEVVDDLHHEKALVANYGWRRLEGFRQLARALNEAPLGRALDVRSTDDGFLEIGMIERRLLTYGPSAPDPGDIVQERIRVRRFNPDDEDSTVAAASYAAELQVDVEVDAEEHERRILERLPESIVHRTIRHDLQSDRKIQADELAAIVRSVIDASRR